MLATRVLPHRFSERLHLHNVRAFFENHEPRVVGMLQPVSLPTTHVQLNGGGILINNFAKQSLSVGFEETHKTPFIFVHLEKAPESSELAIKLIEDHGLGIQFFYRNSNLSHSGLEAPYEAEISRYSLDDIPENLMSLGRNEDARIIVNGKPATYEEVYHSYGGKGSGPKDGPTLFYWDSVKTLKLALAEERIF